MISKQDILERAREWQLRPEVVEKDYVLGWLLAAVGLHEDAASSWILKGGTCVKKCFFETYRFSEDLDFSLLPEAEYSEESISSVLRELGEIVHELSGIEFSPEALTVRARKDKLGRLTFEGRLGYRGPLAAPNWPRILFDITQHEPVVDEPVQRRVLHPYPDGPLPDDSLVSTYSLEELIAEKTRALLERSRPRDLYDVVYIVTNSGELLQFDHAREVFEQKCSAKNLEAPDAEQLQRIVTEAPEIVSEWNSMLAHQLPSLPTAETFLARLADALRWLAPSAPAERVPITAAAPLPRVDVRAGETPIAPAPSTVWRAPVPLETVRFAGANRLLIEFIYSGKARTLEPYSLRRSSRDNVLLYGWELQSSQIKAFDVSKMSGLRTTSRTFVPRYAVEFSAAAGAIPDAPPVQRSLARTFRRPSRRTSSGPVYVFRCPVCQKEFRHRRNDPTLRRHRMSAGGPYCSSRRGYLERVS